MHIQELLHGILSKALPHIHIKRIKALVNAVRPNNAWFRNRSLGVDPKGRIPGLPSSFTFQIDGLFILRFNPMPR